MHIDLAGLIHAPASAIVDGATLSLVIVVPLAQLAVQASGLAAR